MDLVVRLDVVRVAALEASNGVLERATDGQVEEVILATSFTAEGEAAADALAEALRARGLRSTRLARAITGPKVAGGAI